MERWGGKQVQKVWQKMGEIEHLLEGRGDIKEIK